MSGDPYDVRLANVASLPTTTAAILVFFSQVTMLYMFSSVLNASALRKQSNTGERIVAMKLSPIDFHFVLAEFFQLGLILLYIWCCENRPLYEHGDKWHDLDFFYFLSFGFIVASFLTIKENHKGASDLLNRDQTEEWKGWMQVMFLLYHYFHVSEVYNAIRVMISCYVWMTGFGNFSFFYIKRDFGFVRFYQMMWRLNFLVFFLCWTTNNLYILYYICPLHTFYFLLTFATMYTYRQVNHTKYKARVKLFLVGVLIYLVWEFSAMFNLLFLLPTSTHEGYAVGRSGIKYEWHFRSGLDHYSTFFGMIFAMNFPQATLWLKQVEASDKNVITKVSTGFALLFLSYLYYQNIYLLPKLEYNSLHPYTFIFPLTCYIFLRNSTKYLRQRRAVLLENIGKVTLETYLLQHHVWLTSNAKSLLVFLPDYPRLNFLLVTVVYFLISRRLYRLTINLRARCIPETFHGALLSLCTFVIIFTSCFVVAWTLQKLVVPWWLFWAVMALGVVCVQALLSKIMSTTANGSLPIKIIMKFFAVGALGGIGMLLLLMNISVSTISENDIGPFRPAINLLEINQDISCLDHVNNYEVRNFDFKKVESHTELFLDEETVLRFIPPPNSVSYEFPYCKNFLYSESQMSTILQGRKLLVIGRREAIKSLNSLFEMYAIAVKETEKRGKVIFLATDNDFSVTHMRKVPKNFDDFDAVIFDFISLRVRPSDPKNIDYYYQEGDKFTTFEAISEMIRSADSNLPFIFISPVQSRHYNPAIGTRLQSGHFPNHRIGVVDLNKILSLSNVQPSALYRRAAPQLLMHNLHILFNDVKFATNERKLENRELGSQPTNGIAQSPLLGLLIIVLSGVMLATNDNYFGLAAIFKLILAPQSGYVTWEDSVRSLHQSIGVDMPNVSPESSTPRNEEEAELLVQKEKA